ncbi:hypothetical protein DH2020_012066 [Rehmannia glutinosa]|uniref:Uncharacterized protein n=1 Tax=Rehmannia glutinosa TaxID=99300 RepID=A0ABR0XF69_REHGL
MDMAQSSEHLCYVRCNFCNTVLAVGIPCKRLLDTVTVKCGHCSNLSFLSTKPPIQGQCYDHQTSLHHQEIQRIKAANPEIPHREAFSTAAKM